MPIRDIIIVSLLVATVPFCLFRPAFGAVMWIIVSFANPQFLAWGFARGSQPSLLVAVPTLLGCLFFSGKWNRLLNREVILIVMLWLWFSLTTLHSAYDPAFAGKAASAWIHWNQVSKIILMTVVTAAIVNNWHRMRWLALAVAGSFGLLIFKTLPGMILSHGEFRVYGPSNSMIADNNDFGLALNMALPFFFFLARTEASRWVRALMMFLFLATIPTIFFTYSRGALIGLIAVLGCILLQSKQKAILLPMVLFAFLFAAFLTPQAWRDRMNTDTALDASARSRLNVWQYSWALALDYPLMGGGFDAFTPSLFARYAPDPRDVHGPHSIYFGVLAEHGFTGLAIYLTLVLGCFFGLGRIARVARLHEDSFSRSYANMLRISLVGFLISGIFLGRAYFDFLFTLVACVAVLRQLFWAGLAQNDSEPVDDEEAFLVSCEAEDFLPQGEVRLSLRGAEGL